MAMARSSEIRRLASKTVSEMKTFGWMFETNAKNPLNDLSDFLKTDNLTDQDIIDKFQSSIAAGSLVAHPSGLVFIALIEEFISKATLLHKEAEELRLLSEKDVNIYNAHFSNLSVLFKTRELLDNVLLFLDLKDLRKVCMASRFFNDFIVANGNKRRKGEFKVLFKNLDGSVSTMMVGKDDSIKDLRCTYAKKHGITELFPGWLRFNFAGRPLGRMPGDENKTLGNYNIGANCTIQVMGTFRAD